MVYAKSSPPESLKEHTQALLINFEILRKYYEKEVTRTLPKKYREYFWNALNLACKAHDLGKIHTPFQNKILRRLNQQISTVSNIREIPHNLLSPAFIHSQVRNFPDDVTAALYQAIAFHHSRGKEFLTDRKWNDVINVIKLDLSNKMVALEDMRPLFDYDLELPKFTYRNKLIDELPTQLWNFYILLKGLLHRLDHASSAHIEIEVEPIHEQEKAITAYLLGKKVNKSRIWQHKLAKKYHSNVVLQAGTGSGKTEFALYWMNGFKSFYTLPMRTSVNAMFERIKKTFKSEDIGLLHGDSLFYAMEQYHRESETSAEGLQNNIHLMDVSRQLSMPITVSTADQIFTGTFRYEGYEKIYATLSYSRLIIDEIQSYDPDMVAVILKGLVDLVKLGGSFCVITATLPSLYLKYLTERIPSLAIPAPKFREFRRHRMKYYDFSITSDKALAMIESMYEKWKNLLIIVNTVKQAKSLYLLLKKRLKQVHLLHAGFTHQDRTDKELGNEKKRIKGILSDPSGIWVTTQLAEVSLDIDFDAMVTEISTIDSQIQRWGRVWRKRIQNYSAEIPNIVIYGEPSDSGRIYDPDIVDLTIRLLKTKNMSLLAERDEYNFIQKIFGGKAFFETNYFNKFNKSNRIINELDFRVDTKDEAQKLFRKITNVSVIPVDVYNEFKQDIDDSIEVLVGKPKRIEKLQALWNLRQHTVSIPYYLFYEIGHSNITEDQINLDVLISNVGYNHKTGIDRTEAAIGVIL